MQNDAIQLPAAIYVLAHFTIHIIELPPILTVYLIVTILAARTAIGRLVGRDCDLNTIFRYTSQAFRRNIARQR